MNNKPRQLVYSTEYKRHVNNFTCELSQPITNINELTNSNELDEMRVILIINGVFAGIYEATLGGYNFQGSNRGPTTCSFQLVSTPPQPTEFTFKSITIDSNLTVKRYRNDAGRSYESNTGINYLHLEIYKCNDDNLPDESTPTYEIKPKQTLLQNPDIMNETKLIPYDVPVSEQGHFGQDYRATKAQYFTRGGRRRRKTRRRRVRKHKSQCRR